MYGRYKSITYPQSGFKVEGRKLLLSKIGAINIKLHRPIKGDVKTVMLKRMPSGKWFATFSCKIASEPKEKLARLQRCLSRKKRRSRNRKEARIKVARLHEKITNQRNDFLHKVSRKLADSYSTIVVEDFQISNIIQNHKLAKSIADSSWGCFVQMLSYKAEEAGGKVIKVDPKGTTQECSRCGLKVPKTLSQRIHFCPRFGLKMDRDLNASRNILLKIPQELRESTPTEIEPLPVRASSVVEEGSHPYFLNKASPPYYTVVKMSELDLAYIAGIIDGEGDIRIKSRRRYIKTSKFAYIRVSMTDKDTIDFIYNVFKFGCRSIVKRKDKNPKWSDLYVWEVSYRKALEVLLKLIPFLHTKKMEAKKILSEFNYL